MVIRRFLKKLVLKADKKFLNNALTVSHLRRKLRLSSKLAPHDVMHIKFLIEVLKLTPKDTVIDCGANIGRYTEVFARTGARVIAIDPEPTVAGALRELSSKFENITFLPVAVGAEAGSASMYRLIGFEKDPVTFSQSSSLFQDKIQADAMHSFETCVISLPELVRFLGYVSLVKLDVEGAEVPIIEELVNSGTLDQIGFLFAEMHGDRIPSLQARAEYLCSLCEERFQHKVCLEW